MIRKIIHVDMDAFFASIEQRDNPLYRGKPLAVGGGSGRGVIAAASYEARKYGVYSAMPTITARAKCPNLILVKPNGKAYKEVSEHIQAIFHQYTDAVEPLSLDEAFLDVSFQEKGIRSATLLAKEIKDQIKKETNLTASAGVSYNKFLAKIASDYNKPDGLFVIPPEDALSFLETLEIDRFFGVGKVMAAKFHRLGVFTGKDLKKFKKQELLSWFGKAGLYYYSIIRGIDNREVRADRERKSIGAEQTFEKNIDSEKELNDRLNLVIDRMWNSVEKKNAEGKTITVKIKYFDFEVVTRSHTFTFVIDTKEQIRNEAFALLKNEFPLTKAVRLLGVTISNFKNDSGVPEQMNLNF